MRNLSLRAAGSPLIFALLCACSRKESAPAPVWVDHAVPDLRLEPAFPALSFERPVFFAAVPGGDEVVVVEQGGKAWRFPNRASVKPEERKLLLDLSDSVLSPMSKKHPGNNEEGLLGLAFHPKFAANGEFYAHYSVPGGPTGRRGRLSLFFPADRLEEEWFGTSMHEYIVLEVDQPEGNHKGGMIAFGPDGMLYWALGDGGGAGDRHGKHGNGQNTGTLLGKILRLDMNPAAEDALYAVPADNPFVGRAGFRSEIWALGLRNPWRFSFDRATGALWCGDVGQNAHEEVDVIVKGGNYGWRVREGKSAFMGSEDPATLPVLEPVVDHARAEAMSVTGGYVYRGAALPGLRGWYVYGDFVTGNCWRLRRDAATGKVEGPVKLPFRTNQVASFGEDAAGEVFACCFDGKIYKLTGK